MTTLLVAILSIPRQMVVQDAAKQEGFSQIKNEFGETNHLDRSIETMHSHYKYGIGKEKDVASKLQRKGYKVLLSQASRGASDVVAKKGSKKWFIQVKASSRAALPGISPKERRRLKIQERLVPHLWWPKSLVEESAIIHSE